MTKQIVKKETASLATLTTDLYKDIEIPAERKGTPRISLMQSNSEGVTQDGQKLGTYYSEELMENFGETVSIIPVKLYFGATYLKMGEGLLCKSLDGITSIRGDSCRQCPFNEYHLNWKIKGVQPKCKSTVELVGIEISTNNPCILQFKSTSQPCGDKIAKMIKKKVQTGDKKLYAYHVGSSQEKNDKGTFYVSKLVGQPQAIEDAELIKSVIECSKLLNNIEEHIKEEQE